MRIKLRHIVALFLPALSFGLSCHMASFGAPAKAEAVDDPSKFLTASASVQVTPFAKNYEAGMSALKARNYREAEAKLSKALQHIRRFGRAGSQLTMCRLGLGEAYLGMDRSQEAKDILDSARKSASGMDQNSLEYARLLHSLALANSQLGAQTEALSLVQQSQKIRQKLLPSTHHDLGMSHALHGAILYRQGLAEESSEEYKRALSVLEKEPGPERLDYADALYGLAGARRSLHEDSRQMYEEAFLLREKAVQLDSSMSSKGMVRILWQEGTPHSKLIPDPIYPLKYTVLKGMRVSVAPVRSEHLVGVIVQLANCTNKPMRLAVGPVMMEKLSPGKRYLDYLDPAILDITLEEEHISDLTWRRRWLCHIQKTHRIPGYIKDGALDPDNFFGNNLFGTYGCWDSIAKHGSPMVTREEFYFGVDQRKVRDDSAPSYFVNGSFAELKPAYIEPGDARTGVVFFQWERYDKALVRVCVGNAVLDFPFRATASR